MPDSTILFLIICSNNKLPGGDGGYSVPAGLAAQLKPDRRAELLAARKQVWGRIKQDSEARDDLMLAEAPRNLSLVIGPDFGGTDRSALYRPAAERYAGGFYRAMEEHSASRLMGTPHHVLILSGLYGLLRPSEPIQNYRCHVDDHEQIRPTWLDAGLLTNILLDYVKNAGITTLFDLTALNAYRDLINWNRLQQKSPSGLRVWHAYGRQSVGDGLLTPLGEMLGKWLSPGGEAELQAVAGGTKKEIATSTEKIYFTEQDHPAEGAPREVSRQNQAMARKDEIVRISRCVKYLLADESGLPHLNEPHPTIDDLLARREVDAETARAMRRIIRRRDRVEHDRNLRALSDEMSAQRDDFNLVKDWAGGNERRMRSLEECQGNQRLLNRNDA